MQTSAISFGAEYALHKYLGLEYKFEIFDGGDKYDCVVAGRTIDVKSTEGYMQELKIQDKDLKKDIDIFVPLVKWIGKPTYQILGWIEKWQFEDLAEYKQRRFSKMWCVDINNMKDIKLLKGMMF